jgi:hypothetical protein
MVVNHMWISLAAVAVAVTGLTGGTAGGAGLLVAARLRKRPSPA